MYVNCPFIRAEREVEGQAGKTMVKILEIGVQLDAEEDDDCCEIDLAEFAKKVNLKAADDDVVVVAAKGPIKVKVEVDQSGKCLNTNGNLRDRAAGDCLENPDEIEEDETTIHHTKSSEAKRDIKPAVKCESEPFEEVAADMSPVKCEPEEGNGADELYEQVIKMSPVKCESEGLEQAVPDTLPVKSDHEDGGVADEHFEKVIPDMSLLKFGSVCFEEFIPNKPAVQCEPEDGNGADELFQDIIPNMPLLTCKSDCLEEVSPDISPVKCEPEDGNIAYELVHQVIPDMLPVKCGSESFEEVVADMSLLKCGSECFEEIIPDMLPVKCGSESFEEVVADMFLLKCGSECFEEIIPDRLPEKRGPEDGNGANKCVEEEAEAYDHLPEMDIGGRMLDEVLDEEDNDDFVVVGRESL